MDPKKRRIRRVKKLAESVRPLAPADHHPGTGRGHTKKERRPSGNSRAYLAARIARDRPDILDRMKTGEFEYVHQAAIAAGIVEGKVKHDAWQHSETI